MRKYVWMCALAGASVVGPLWVGQASSQEPAAQRGERRGGRRARMDPEQMRQRMMDRLKETLGAEDDEWLMLQPRIEKVMAARRNLKSGAGSRFGRRGRRGGGPGAAGAGAGRRPGAGGPGAAGAGAGRRPGAGGPGAAGRGPGGAATGPGAAGGGSGRAQRELSPVGKAAQDLRTALSEQASPKDIKARLAALRTAREQAKPELAKARKDLLELVTQRQEAQLVLMSVLD
jgi:hypothetical protein